MIIYPPPWPSSSSLASVLRIRPTNLRPDPDPAYNLTGGEKKLKTHSGKTPWAKLEVLRKAGYKDFNSSDKIYMVRNNLSQLLYEKTGRIRIRNLRGKIKK